MLVMRWVIEVGGVGGRKGRRREERGGRQEGDTRGVTEVRAEVG